MRIALDAGTRDALKRRLSESEDAESLGGDDYALDLFDEDPPLCLELSLASDGADVLAAAEMRYDEPSDGYYLHRRRFDIETIEKILRSWIIQ